jgi:hypothetical protein
MNELNEIIFYKPKNFKIQELVLKHIYEKFGEKCWLFFDSKLLWTLDKIREKYGAIIVNDWLWGGEFQNRGFREFNSSVGAQYSQHKFGRAVDFHFKSDKITCKEMRKTIIENPNFYEFKYITSVEDFDGMNWIHIDVRNWDKNKNGILVFKK